MEITISRLLKRTVATGDMLSLLCAKGKFTKMTKNYSSMMLDCYGASLRKWSLRGRRNSGVGGGVREILVVEPPEESGTTLLEQHGSDSVGNCCRGLFMKTDNAIGPVDRAGQCIVDAAAPVHAA